NDDGTVDTTFGDAGYRRVSTSDSDAAAGFSWLPDGKLLIGFGSFASIQPNHVARLTAEGALDTSYGGGDGIGDLPTSDDRPFGGLVETVAQPSGRAVGLFFYRVGEGVGEEGRFGLAALTPEGQPDASFRFGTDRVDTVGRFGAFRDTAVL